MKTLQEQYKAIQNGQGNKNQFLKHARSLFPEYFNQYTDYSTAVNVLKSKQIISEAAGGVVSKGFDIWDWKKILENLKPEDLEIGKIYKYSGEITMGPHKGEKITGELEFEEKINDDMFRFIWKKIDTPNAPNARVGRPFQTSKTGLQYLTESVKDEEKETSKEVKDYRKNAYDNADMKNADNINFNEIMKGFYCELKDEKNAGKTGDELKEIVVKNLAKDPLYYTKNGEFGVKGVGYTTEAPGLGEPKAPKGKHKSSGYGDLKEGKIKENTDILDYYASTIEANNMTEDEAYAYLEDIGLPHFQINSIMNYVFPIKESEQKLRSLIRTIIKEELNSTDYKKALRDLERPHTKDKKALDDIIDIYKSQIQGLDSIKKNIKD